MSFENIFMISFKLNFVALISNNWSNILDRHQRKRSPIFKIRAQLVRFWICRCTAPSVLFQAFTSQSQKTREHIQIQIRISSHPIFRRSIFIRATPDWSSQCTCYVTIVVSCSFSLIFVVGWRNLLQNFYVVIGFAQHPQNGWKVVTILPNRKFIFQFLFVDAWHVTRCVFESHGNISNAISFSSQQFQDSIKFPAMFYNNN